MSTSSTFSLLISTTKESCTPFLSPRAEVGVATPGEADEFPVSLRNENYKLDLGQWGGRGCPLILFVNIQLGMGQPWWLAREPFPALLSITPGVSASKPSSLVKAFPPE